MKYFFLFSLFFVFNFGYSQNLEDTISVTKSPTRFIYHGKKLKTSEFNKIVPINDRAYIYVVKARNYIFLYELLAASTGFCLGYPTGQALAGKSVNAELYLVSAGSLILMIQSYNQAKKNAIKAVYYYNKEIIEKSKKQLTK